MTQETPHAARASILWLGLALAALLLAGLYSLVPLAGRAPGLSFLVTDPLFARRSLVVHVNLALVVWFLSFLVALYTRIPTRERGVDMASRAAYTGAVGILLMVTGGGWPDAEPVLSNYIPVVRHPLFFSGLLLFALSVAAAFLNGRLLPGREAAGSATESPVEEARPALRAAAVAFLFALMTFYAAWMTTPRDLGALPYYEIVAWGGGHVLQFAHVAGMMAGWVMLVTAVTGKAPFSRRSGALLFGLLVLPLFYAPVVAARGPFAGEARVWFTRLMQFGIFPVTLVVLSLSLKALHRHHAGGLLSREALLDPRTAGFLTSAFLAVTGFLLGSFIRSSSTLVPGHYHASIGAVTTAYMAMGYELVRRMGFVPGDEARWRRRAAVQPVIFGTGQLLFALGLGYAGLFGLERKVYGAEQAVRSLHEIYGLMLMAFGGILAVSGGIFFLCSAGGAYVRTACYSKNRYLFIKCHCEERSDEAIPSEKRLLRFARNDMS